MVPISNAVFKGVKVSFESYLCLEASAGSGKTFALSVRYIALLLRGNHPNKILALTFTNKAASEMLQRITTTFCNLHKDEQKGELEALCELLEMDAKKVLAIRDEMMGKFLASELKISTFDSFFGMILRQFSLNLGLMPDFSSVEDNSELINNEFNKLIIANSMVKDVAQYLYDTNNTESDFFNKLKSLSQSKLSQFNATVPSPKNALQKYYQLCDIALRLHSNTNYNKNFDKNLTLEDIAKKAVVNKYTNRYFDKVRDNLEFVSARDEFIQAFKEYYLALEKYEISQISKFVKLYKKAIANVNNRENSLSFDDITNWVNELLTNKNSQDIDMLYFRLDAKIRHILIDEFQDTSIKQYEILEPLIAESVAGVGQSGLGSFFYVGDTKQSIYRFRGGQKELFNKLRDNFNQIKSQSLDKNYRSDKLIVEYVNDLFRSKYANYIDQIPNSKNEGYVKVVKFEKEKHLEQILNNINELTQAGVAHEDIAILCWKNKDIDQIKNFLEFHGIAVSTQIINLLIKSSNVAAVVEFAKYCIFGDEIYALTTQEIIQSKKSRLELKTNTSVAQTLKFIAKYLEINPYDIDMLKLYEISAGYSDIYDFVFNIDHEKAKSAKSSQNGINIMTVHKSKGLQFDHVIVVDYLGKPSPNQDKFLIEYNLSLNSWDIKLNNNALEYLGDEEFINLKNRQKSLDKDETINKIYVALTRAKHSLIILAVAQPNGNNISYFTPYQCSDKNIEYVSLQEYQMGSIQPSIKEITSKSDMIELEPFVIVGRQEIDNSKNAQDELNLDAIYFGKALHYYLESFNFIDANSKDIAKNRLYNKFGSSLNDKSLKDIIKRVDRLLDSAKFNKIIANKKLYKEQDIGFDGELRRIDLLCMNESEAHIIDYKSSLNGQENHRIQVCEYAKILSKIYPQKSVKASIIYILNDEIQIQDV